MRPLRLSIACLALTALTWALPRRQDTGLLTPADVMALTPTPPVVIYQ